MGNPSRQIVIFAAAASLALAVAGRFSAAAQTNQPGPKPAARADLLFPDPVVAKGKGFEIKRSELDEAAIAAKASGVVGAAQTDDRYVLDKLITKQVLLGRANDADRAKGREQVETELEILRTNSTAETSLNRWLRTQGQTREQWVKQKTEQAAISALIERELKVTVTDDNVKKFYDDNPGKFEQPEMVRVSHIQINTRDPVTGAELSDDVVKEKRKKAEEIQKRAKAGEDFAKLAREYSDDPNAKGTGGALPAFARGQPNMPAEFELTAFSLNTNQVSEVVTTSVACHIIKLNEKIPARKIKLEDKVALIRGQVYTLDSLPGELPAGAKTETVSNLIREMLKLQEIQKQMPAYVERLHKDADVQILDDSLKLKDLPLPSSGKSADK